MIITGMTEACLLILCVLVFRAVFRWGNAPVALRPGRRCSLRFMAAWAINWAFYAGSLWTVVAYGVCFGADKTENMLLGWLTSLAVSWFLMEPGFILLIVLLPCVCRNSACAWINDRANEVGCDLSIFM